MYSNTYINFDLSSFRFALDTLDLSGRGGETLTDEDQWLEVQAETVYDEANAKVEFLKASCQRTTVPEPKDEDSQAVSMKEDIVGVSKSV